VAKKKIFVLSMDAMVHEDVALLMGKPNFSKIMARRAEVEQVRSVYPASTYPAHTTLMTGCWPGKHGMWANFPLKTVDDHISHWPLYHKLIEAEDLFAAAKRAGCSTAAVYWPITACNPNIDHIINEYFFFYKGERENIGKVFEKMGADAAAIQAVEENLHRFPWKYGGELRREILFNDFITGCTCSLIRNVQPDVMLTHNCWLDSLRHAYGVFDEKVIAGLDDMDEWLGEIIEAMEEAGVYEDTNFVILSDHGQRDYNRIVSLNVLLERGGFIDLAPNGTIYDWRAYAQSNGRSSTVYLADGGNEKLYGRVYDYLRKLQEEQIWGIETIHTKDELLTRYGQRGPYSFMIESDENTEFENAWSGEPLRTLADNRVKGAHGYEPEKGPQPVFLAHGPAFKEGAVIPRADMVDIAPTLAGVLGETMPEADGRCLNELLNM